MKSFLWLVVVIQVSTVVAFYLPQRSVSSRNDPVLRRQDDEHLDDDMDHDASSPNQNQDDGTSNPDGFGENDPDGPYEESPREEESQADLERFFDDHLGASDRDGMDRENLPTNTILTVANSRPFSSARPEQYKQLNLRRIARSRNYSHNQNPLIANEDSDERGSQDLLQGEGTGGMMPERPQGSMPVDYERQTSPMDAADNITAHGSGVVEVEDDEMDRVYVTNKTDQPFKIDALGGYDPEEDFQSASIDIDTQAKLKRDPNGEEANPDATNDIVFNDPEPKTMFNDASETDEVAFARGEPYQTDLEAEMQQEVESKSNNPQPRTDTHQSSPDDESEGNWVNDGVDDMDIPSQVDQDRAILRGTPSNETSSSPEMSTEAQEPNQDSDDQRMPNADYMKKELQELEDDSDKQA